MKRQNDLSLGVNHTWNRYSHYNISARVSSRLCIELLGIPCLWINVILSSKIAPPSLASLRDHNTGGSAYSRCCLLPLLCLSFILAIRERQRSTTTVHVE